MPIESESPEEMGYDTIRYNLSESSVTDRPLGDLLIDPNKLQEIVLAYGDHRGLAELRCEIAGLASGIEYSDVLVTAGASAGLFAIASALLDRDSHVVVQKPNYATNIETPRAIGCELSLVELKFESQYRIDLDEIRQTTRSNTKYISITYPHNPTGAVISRQDLDELIEFVEQRNIYLLVDETYRDMIFVDDFPIAASLSPKVISVSSMSKTYGIPGIRIGWVISQEKALVELLLSAKEQIGICGSALDETVALHALQQRPDWLKTNTAYLTTARAIVEEWIAEEGRVEWVLPDGGCVCFPRISPAIDIDMATFYQRLYDEYGTYVGAGHWFEQSRRHFRIGYGWPKREDLQGGLSAISAVLDDLTQEYERNPRN